MAFRLTEEAVRKIHADPRNANRIAKDFGTTRQTVYLIKSGKSHVKLGLRPTRKYAEIALERELQNITQTEESANKTLIELSTEPINESGENQTHIIGFIPTIED